MELENLKEKIVLLDNNTNDEVTSFIKENFKDYDFSVGDTFLVGDVEFRTKYFYCPNCLLDISFQEMKDYEKGNRKK